MKKLNSILTVAAVAAFSCSASAASCPFANIIPAASLAAIKNSVSSSSAGIQAIKNGMNTIDVSKLCGKAKDSLVSVHSEIESSVAVSPEQIQKKEGLLEICEIAHDYLVDFEESGDVESLEKAEKLVKQLKSEVKAEKSASSSERVKSERKERESKERESKERESKERESKERESKEHPERESKQRETKEHPKRS